MSRSEVPTILMIHFQNMSEECCTEGGCTSEFVKIDAPAPHFDLPAYDPIKDDQTTVSLDSVSGKWSVLFFYPADFTFVCPTELKDLTNSKDDFAELGVEVLAVSTDTVFTHRAWVQHEGLMKGFPFKMLADHTLETSFAYGVLDADSGMAARGTFIIDPKGIVRGIEITSGPLGRNNAELLRKIEALQFMAQNPGTACPARWTAGAKTIKPSIKISGDVESALS